MAEIAWTLEAERWLADIYEYIAADNPAAAEDTIDGIYDRAQVLKMFPECGSRYWASARHVRILLYGHYRIAYLGRMMATSTSLASSTARWTSAGTRCEVYRWNPIAICRKSTEPGSLPSYPRSVRRDSIPGPVSASGTCTRIRASVGGCADAE